MAGLFDTNALVPAPIQTANPLEMAAQGISLKNALLGNQIQQAQYDSDKVWGNALLGATDASGNTDYAKARATAASDPAAAYGAAQAIRGQNAARQDDLVNQDEQLSYQEHTRDAMAHAFIRVAQNPTDANIRGTAAFMGTLTPSIAPQIKTAAQNVLSLPSGMQRQEALKQLATSALPTHEAIQQTFGSPTIVDDGRTIHTGTQASGMDGGAFTPAAGMQKHVSPEFNYTPVTITGPDGTPRIVPRGQVVGSEKPTVPPEVMGSGRYPNTQPPSGGNSSGPQQGGYVVGPPAGQVQAQQATAEASAKSANALMDAAAHRNDRLAMLGNMASDLTGFSSGPGYERLRKAAAFFDNWTGAGLMSSQIESAQGFNKWAQQLANAQAQALGASDARLGAAEHANPNSGLQEGTNRMMIHQLMGNEEAINAKAQAWQASGLPASQYQQWNQKFSQNFDPRAFQLLKMTPEEQQTMFKGMKASGQLETFKKTYNAMAAAGLVPSGR